MKLLPALIAILITISVLSMCIHISNVAGHPIVGGKTCADCHTMHKASKTPLRK